MQERIDHIQATYRKWLSLHEQLLQMQTLNQEANSLMQELKDFYFEGEFREFFEQIEQGSTVNLKTQGEHSIMSEDALWNAYQDYQNLLWQQLRDAVNALDKNH